MGDYACLIGSKIDFPRPSWTVILDLLSYMLHSNSNRLSYIPVAYYGSSDTIMCTLSASYHVALINFLLL
jgi:hypothetical protein